MFVRGNVILQRDGEWWLLSVCDRHGGELSHQKLSRDDMRMLGDEIYSELDCTCDECGETGEITGPLATGAEVCSHCMDGHNVSKGGC